MTAPSAVPILAEQDRRLAVLGLGVVGGAVLGFVAVKHLFVVGMEDKERRQLIGFAAAAAALYGAVHLFDIDEKWWNVEKSAEALQEAYDAWQAAQAAGK